MNAYLMLSKTDDETDSVLAELCRFSVRTIGAFAAYGAFSFELPGEMREITERVGEVCPGRVDVQISGEESLQMTATSGGIPAKCIDPVTRQIDWTCVGSAEPSMGPKAEYFAVAQVHASLGEREAVHAQLTVTGGVTAIGRMADPNLLLVEFGATDCELLSEAVDAAAGIREVARLRAATAVRPLIVDQLSSD